MARVLTDETGAWYYDVTEEEKVEAWRLKTLLEAGYPLEIAERLAVGPIDLHRAVGLLEQGCTVETAAAILL